MACWITRCQSCWEAVPQFRFCVVSQMEHHSVAIQTLIQGEPMA